MSDTVIPTESTARTSALPGQAGAGAARASAKSPAARMAGHLTRAAPAGDRRPGARSPRSEEHTSELQSHSDLVCRLLLEKKSGRRTAHTLIPSMYFRDGRARFVYGTMSGEGQPQTQAALVTRMVDDDLRPQPAIQAPRML